MAHSVSDYVPHQQRVDEENAASLAQALNTITKQNMEQRGKMAQIGAEGEQQRQTQSAQLGQSADIANQMLEPGGLVEKAGEKGLVPDINRGGVKLDPSMQKIAAKHQKDAGAEADRLTKSYGNLIKPYDQQLTAVDNVVSQLNLGTSQGHKNAMINLARLAEGPNQRLLQGVIQSMGGDSSIFGSEQKITNYLNNQPEGKLPPAAVDAMKESALQHYETMKPQMSGDISAFKRDAPLRAQILGQQGNLDKYLSSVDEGVKGRVSRIDKFSDDFKKSKGPTGPATPPPTGRVDMAKDFLSKLIMGPQSQGPAQTSQASAPGPQAAPAEPPESLEHLAARRAAAGVK